MVRYLVGEVVVRYCGVLSPHPAELFVCQLMPIYWYTVALWHAIVIVLCLCNASFHLFLPDVCEVLCHTSISNEQ